MKTGIFIVMYNRPEYLRRCLDSFKKAEYPKGCMVMLIDDGSRDADALKQYQDFSLQGIPIIKLQREKSVGIKENIKLGYETLFSHDCDIVMNFDADAVIKQNAIMKIKEASETHTKAIVTGFNSTTKNKDGSERHPIVSSHEGYHLKKSVGGLNMCVHEYGYRQYFHQALEGVGNWDHMACISSEQQGQYVVCLFPSVVQHIGLVSSMGHSSDVPDVADDFYNLQLPNVTLIGADTNHFHELEKAAKISTSDVQFAAVKMLNPSEVKSATDYNFYCMKRFNEHVDTPYALVIQWDGFLINYKAWEQEFLSYDFIGAAWGYHDGKNVGNGGFSLRSKKLLEILATDTTLKEFMPEDHHICRTYRPYLEKTYGIKYAPIEVADRFSLEAHGFASFPGANKYNGQLGFHGWNVDYTGWDLGFIPKNPNPQPPQRNRMRGFTSIR